MALLRTLDNVYLHLPAVVWIDGELFTGNAVCKVRTSTGELFEVEAAECLRALGHTAASNLTTPQIRKPHKVRPLRRSSP